MAFNITDNDEITIYITDGWREWYIPKFRLTWTVDEPIITLYWTDTEKGTSGIRRELPLDYTDVTFGYTSPSSAAEIASVLENYVISAFGGSGFVESVSAESNQPVKVDNTDPVNPILNFEIDTKTETADFTLALDDAWDFIECDTIGSIKITVPPNSSVAFPIGTQMTFTTLSAGLTYFEEGLGVTIHSLNDYLGITSPHGVARLTKFDTDKWYLDGDLRIALDADAEAYINAVEGTGATLSTATKGYINSWFLSAKANGYYSKYHAVYLFIGGTAAAHKFNAINPADTDAAFRMVFTGSPTHNSNGVTFNGTTQYGNSKYNPSTSGVSADSKHYSIRLRTVGSGSQFGAYNGSFQGDAMEAVAGVTLYWAVSVGYESGTNPSPKTGTWQLDRSSSTVAQIIKDNVQIDTDASTSTGNVNIEVVLGARNANGTVNNFSADNVDFFAIGNGFTAGELLSETADILQLQTDLGR